MDAAGEAGERRAVHAELEALERAAKDLDRQGSGLALVSHALGVVIALALAAWLALVGLEDHPDLFIAGLLGLGAGASAYRIPGAWRRWAYLRSVREGAIVPSPAGDPTLPDLRIRVTDLLRELDALEEGPGTGAARSLLPPGLFGLVAAAAIVVGGILVWNGFEAGWTGIGVGIFCAAAELVVFRAGLLRDEITALRERIEPYRALLPPAEETTPPEASTRLLEIETKIDDLRSGFWRWPMVSVVLAVLFLGPLLDGDVPSLLAYLIYAAVFAGPVAGWLVLRQRRRDRDIRGLEEELEELEAATAPAPALEEG